MGLADSRLAAQWLEEAARELGLCVIAPDRPGTGGTDRRWLSQLADWAAGKGRAGSDPPQPGSAGSTSPPVSTEDGLRSLHDDPVIIPPVPLPRVSRQQRPQQRPLPVGQIMPFQPIIIHKPIQADTDEMIYETRPMRHALVESGYAAQVKIGTLAQLI